MEGYATLSVARDERGVATVTMDRPEVRNAFDATLIGELTDAARALGDDRDVRVVVLTGAGPVFSAGADLNWMRAMRGRGFDENLADARRMQTMFRTLWDLPKPLIGRVNGHAIAGGTGLVTVCDVVVASRDATFGFTEVALGIAPAVISPFAVRAIGQSHARALFTTGARFDAERAERIGLVHHVVDPEALDAEVAAVVAQCLRAGPAGAAAAKRLPELAAAPLDEASDATVRVIAELRVAPEGQEGMAAFLERRQPSWVPGA